MSSTTTSFNDHRPLNTPHDISVLFFFHFFTLISCECVSCSAQLNAYVCVFLYLARQEICFEHFDNSSIEKPIVKLGAYKSTIPFKYIR